MKRGIYETNYGNAAYVSGPKSKWAYDIDAGGHIPMALVTDKWLRKAKLSDRPDYAYARSARRIG